MMTNGTNSRFFDIDFFTTNIFGRFRGSNSQQLAGKFDRPCHRRPELISRPNRRGFAKNGNTKRQFTHWDKNVS